jgi:hypothetical protein
MRPLGDVHPGEDEDAPTIGLKPIPSVVVPRHVFRREVPDVAVYLKGQLHRKVSEIEPVLAVRPCDELDRWSWELIVVEETERQTFEDTRLRGADEARAVMRFRISRGPRRPWRESRLNSAITPSRVTSRVARARSRASDRDWPVITAPRSTSVLKGSVVGIPVFTIVRPRSRSRDR